MRLSQIRTLFTEHGVALPMALIAMLMLAALMLAFLSLSSSEPQIAANHLSKTQARAQAEGGIERTPNGVVFVDTTTGNNITPSTPPSEYANVSINVTDASGRLIVNRSLSINGNVTYRGLVYVQDGLTYHGTGSGGGVQGAMVAQGVTGASSDVSGNSKYISRTTAGTSRTGTAPSRAGGSSNRGAGGRSRGSAPEAFGETLTRLRPEPIGEPAQKNLGRDD